MRQRLRTIGYGIGLILVGVALMWGWSKYQHFASDHEQLHYTILVINELNRRDPTLVPSALQAAGLQQVEELSPAEVVQPESR